MVIKNKSVKLVNKQTQMKKIKTNNPVVNNHIDNKDEMLLGQVDYVGVSKVEGWICDPSDLKKRLKLIAMIKGREIVSAVANIYREDLENATIGDGRYGFTLEISSSLLKQHTIEIVEAESLQVIKYGYIDKTVKIGNDSGSELPAMLIDLSDLFFYIEHHDNLSGIQRVQVETITAIINNALLPTANIKLVIYSELEQDFYEISHSFFEGLISDLKQNPSNRNFKREPDKLLHLEKYYQSLKLNIATIDSKNIFLIMLGAGWSFPSYFVGVRKLKKMGVRFISILYDLIPIKLPQFCQKGTAEVFKIFIKKLIRNSDCVLGISEHTVLDISQYSTQNKLKLPPVSLFKIGQSSNTKNSIFKQSACPVQGDFVLFVSTIEGRKNHQSALDIWKQLFLERGSKIPSLVFVGRLGWRVEALVEELYACNFLDGKVVILSEVSDFALTSLYENCLLTIYPSLYEGWGLPVTESLSFGKICLCSDRTSLPEAGKDFAIYYDIEDVNDGLIKVKRILDDASYKNSIELKIKNEYIPVSWTESAQSLIDAMEIVTNQTNSLELLPEMDKGEYSFSAISYQTDDSIQGQKVARHLTGLARPKLTNQRLTIENYILGEECLADGKWFPAENNVRWLGVEGASLNFTIKNQSLNHLLTFLIDLPYFIKEVSLETKHWSRLINTWTIINSSVLIQLQSAQYSTSNEVEIEFIIKEIIYNEGTRDSRGLSIGLKRLSIIPADSLEDRLILLEKFLFQNEG